MRTGGQKTRNMSSLKNCVKYVSLGGTLGMILPDDVKCAVAFGQGCFAWLQI